MVQQLAQQVSRGVALHVRPAVVEVEMPVASVVEADLDERVDGARSRLVCGEDAQICPLPIVTHFAMLCWDKKALSQDDS